MVSFDNERVGLFGLFIDDEANNIYFYGITHNNLPGNE